jgi:hypothetical protein
VRAKVLAPEALDMNRKLILALLACSSLTALAADKPAKMKGYISESKCGAMHNSAAPDAACVKKCISGGAKPVLVDAKKNVWAIDNPDAVTDDYGKAVTVMATSDDSNKSVHIDRVTFARGLNGTSGMMDH